MAVALAAATLLTACGPADPVPPSLDELTARLEVCPEGDTAWRDVVDAFQRPEDMPAAAELAAHVERCADRWEPEWFHGEVALRQGDLSAAEEAYGRAAAWAESQGDDVGIACSLNRLGVFAYYNQQFELSEQHYRKALAASRRTGRRDLEGYALNNLAGTELDLNRISDALATMAAASEALETAGEDRHARSIAYNLAVLSMELGNWNGVRDELERLDAACTANEDRDLGPYVKISLAAQARMRGELDQAAERYRSLPTDQPRIAIERAIGLGRVAFEREAYEEASSLFEAALGISREHGFPVEDRAEIWGRAAEAQAGRKLEARARLRALVQERYADDTDEGYSAWLAWQWLGRLERELGAPREAANAFRRSIDAIERLGNGLDMTADGLYFLSGRNDPYLDLSWLLAGSAETGELPSIFDRAQMRALGRLGDTPGSIESFDPAGLRPDEAWLGFIIGTERSVGLVAHSGELTAFRLAGSDEVGADVRSYLDALRRPGRALAAQSDPMRDLAADVESGRRVRRAWLDPLLVGLDGVRRLYVAPDAELATLPLAALPLDGDSGAFLADRWTVLRMPRPGSAPRVGARLERVLLAGDPVRESRSLLPRAAGELSQLENIWGAERAEVLGADGFTAEQLETALGDTPQLVHFATHAEASSLDPRRSGLELSAEGRLGFDRIGRLPLNDAWIVLSACSTGEGEAIPGQGVVGLGWAFLTAGSRGVLMTLWELDDDVAAEFSVAFHRALATKGDPAAAMDSAVAELRARRPHPYFWAPYTLTVRPG